MASFLSKFHSRISRGACLIFLFCFCAFLVFIVTDRKHMVYYLPDEPLMYGEDGIYYNSEYSRISSRPEVESTLTDGTKTLTSSRSSLSSASRASRLSSKHSQMSTTKLQKSSARGSKYSKTTQSSIYSTSSATFTSSTSGYSSKTSSFESPTNVPWTENGSSKRLSFTSNQTKYRDVATHIDDVKTYNDDVRVFEKSLNDADNNYANYSQLQEARLKRIQYECAKLDDTGEKIYGWKAHMVYYSSEAYNFAFCKVPKSGSTFWTGVFAVLKSGVEYGSEVLNGPRAKVHGTMGRYLASFSQIAREHKKTILVSRCPYSRLYSAFVDKSFLLLIHSTNYLIRGFKNAEIEEAPCQNNVTFQEFLDWVIRNGKQGNMLDRHWSPVYGLCRPCDVKPFVLVKQETFAADVEYALQQINVEEDKFDFIKKGLHGQRAELSLPGVIKTLFGSLKRKSKVCVGYQNFSKRVWLSLQIQGYINRAIEFPEHKFTTEQFSDSEYFTEVVLQTMGSYPMTSEQRRGQRQNFLHEAYKDIRPDTIQGILDLYKQDFEVYGYSKIPPANDS